MHETKTIRVDRLLVLAAGLEAGAAAMKARDLFNLNGWTQHFEFDGNPEDFEIKDMTTLSCGFAGCAAGFGAAMPELHAQGLHLLLQSDWSKDVVPAYRIDAEYCVTGWQALDAFFGLTSKQTYYLFDQDYYVLAEQTDPLAVASRIRDFVTDPLDDETVRAHHGELREGEDE